MRVDNSSLTGESDPLLRTVECTNKDNPLETDNLAFFGTLCKEGVGRGVVIQIGDDTIIGQIANLAAEAGTQDTPLRTEIDRFIIIISAIAIFSGVIFFILGFALGYDAIQNIIFAIGIIVANVPEGLLATVTAALTITAKRLAKKKVLVKNLEAVETLGSTSCICSDKTGTLTQNKMTVEHLWYGGKIFKGDNAQKCGPSFKYEYDVKDDDFKALHESAIVCSEAVFELPENKAPLEEKENEKEVIKLEAKVEHPIDIGRQIQPPEKEIEIVKNKQEAKKAEKAKKSKAKKEPKKKKEPAPKAKSNQKEEPKLWLDTPAIGDASETALIKFFQPIEDIRDTRERHPLKEMEDKSLGRIPFNSSWKYALSIVDYRAEDSVNCIFIKGAPEKIWQMSSHLLVDNTVVPIDEYWQKEFQRVNRIFGEGGERVLGFAKMHLPRDKFPYNFQFNCKSITENNYPMDGFVFTGLISLIDPPR